MPCRTGPGRIRVSHGQVGVAAKHADLEHQAGIVRRDGEGVEQRHRGGGIVPVDQQGARGKERHVEVARHLTGQLLGQAGGAGGVAGLAVGPRGVVESGHEQPLHVFRVRRCGCRRRRRSCSEFPAVFRRLEQEEGRHDAGGRGADQRQPAHLLLVPHRQGEDLKAGHQEEEVPCPFAQLFVFFHSGPRPGDPLGGPVRLVA